MKKIITLFFCALFFLQYSAYALSAESAILIDADSGRVLFEHNAFTKRPMASTTKIMTGLIACEKGKLDEMVTVSPYASGTEGSSLWLKIGEKLSLEDLLYGLMLKSGNDAAIAIAEHIAGNVDAFVLMMNERAKELGAQNTNFQNPHGLDAEGHYTTAYDLGLIAMEAMKNDKFVKFASTKTYAIPMEGENWNRALKNHNKLLWKYNECIWGKTGFTKSAKRCLVSAAEKDGGKLICVTLNAPNDWNDHMYLFDYGFNNFKTKHIVEKNKKITSLKINDDISIDLIAKTSFSMMISTKDQVKTEVLLDKVSLPVSKGEKCGVIKIYIGEKEMGQVELIADRKIIKPSLFYNFLKKAKGIFNA